MTFVTRAFSAEAPWAMVPGALPEATDESAPLVLNATLNYLNSTLGVECWTLKAFYPSA